MRLIDADKFLSQLEDQYMEHDITREKYIDLEDRIMQQPTIEAVKAVRCKDCKHWWLPEEICDRKRTITAGSWFCADGERRQG